MTDARLQGQQMLAGYFDDLLAEPELDIVQPEAEVLEEPVLANGESTTAGKVVEQVIAQADPEKTPQEQRVKETPATGDEARAPAEEETEAVEPAPVAMQRPALELEIPPAMAHWREAEQHDCLILQLNGLRLAMPLCCADLPKPWPEGVTTWHEGWFQGGYTVEDRPRVVVHLAELILPGRGIPFREGIVVPMLELPWSLRVDDLEGSRRFASADISWNTQAAKRPWLAGMVKGQPLAVIDPLELAKLLATAWKQ